MGPREEVPAPGGETLRSPRRWGAESGGGREEPTVCSPYVPGRAVKSGYSQMRASDPGGVADWRGVAASARLSSFHGETRWCRGGRESAFTKLLGTLLLNVKELLAGVLREGALRCGDGTRGAQEGAVAPRVAVRLASLAQRPGRGSRAVACVRTVVPPAAG